jgi:hypothetical protein
MDSTDAKTATSMLGAEADRIRSLLREQKFSEALSASEALLAITANHRDAL